MSFYQWIFNRNQSVWVIAQFDTDGDVFTLCGSSQEYKIVIRDGFGGAKVKRHGNYIEANEEHALIVFGSIIQYPAELPKR